MMNTRTPIHVLTVALAMLTPLLAIRPARAQPEAGDAPPVKPPITVAVLNFDVGQATDPALAALFSDVVAITLTVQGDFRVVDRTSIEQTLREQQLQLTGLVSNDDAIRVGKLVGARLLVIGKVIELGKARMLTAKVIGTETTLMDGVLVKGGLDQPADELIAQLANEVSAKIVDAGPRLVAQEDAPDPAHALVAALRERALPTVAVFIPEEHRPALPQRQPPDPAAETEIKKLLIEAGFKVMDLPQNDLADWTRDVRTGQSTAPWPQGLEPVDFVVIGEGFSEDAGSIQRLRSATARLEVNLIARADGRIVLADRATARAVDLSPEIAGKTALQRAGRQLGVAVLRHFADTTRPAPEPQAPPANP